MTEDGDTTMPDTGALVSGSVFDRWSWFYAWCREHVFANHTDKVVAAMLGCPSAESHPIFVELGCGPGVYARAIAERFPKWQVVGLDSSERLLSRARRKSAVKAASNLAFLHGDICRPKTPLPAADFILASRLLLILSDRTGALESAWEMLRPGGCFLICEPRRGVRTQLPALALRLLDLFARDRGERSAWTARALDESELRELAAGQAWQSVEQWHDARYMYALCRKPLRALPVTAGETGRAGLQRAVTVSL